jgi:ketosteroid isomerase-like protein
VVNSCHQSRSTERFIRSPTERWGVTRRDVVRAYYDALDAGTYDRLADLLAPDFVQRRPDRTFDGRERFVRFVREERPRTDTTHDLETLCRCEDGDGDRPTTVFVRGRLRTDDGEDLFGFVDVHRVVDGRIRSLDTYTG